MTRYPMRLIPVPRSMIWGGDRLKTKFNKPFGIDSVGESWELTVRPEAQSVIANGIYSGNRLCDILDTGDSFPLLIKFIDAHDDLSVQVHPDDNVTDGNGTPLGKTEMWYILDAEKGAKLYYGFKKNITKSEFEDHIKSGTLETILNAVTVNKGDCFFIPSGTIHAIGGGILIAEIQQNSNITYRVYDYNRKDKNGNTRPLHIEKAIDVTNLTPPPVNTSSDGETLASCKYFNVKKRVVNNSLKSFTDENSFLSVLCIEGEVEFLDIRLSKGECAFVPSNMGEFEIKGNGTIIESRV